MAATREARLAYIAGTLAAHTEDVDLMAEVGQIIAEITRDERGDPYPADVFPEPIDGGDVMDFGIITMSNRDYDAEQAYVNWLFARFAKSDNVTADDRKIMLTRSEVASIVSSRVTGAGG